MKTVLPAIFRARKPVFWLGVGLFAAVAVLLAAILCPGGFGGGPTYQDRTASEWLVTVSDGGESPTNAVKAFRAMGRDGVLFLARTVKMPIRERIGIAILYKYNPPERWREALLKVLNLSIRTDEPRERAAWILSQLGPAAEPALPEMLRVFRRADENDPVTHPVGDALQAMGEKMAFMVPELIQGLKGTNLEHAVACAEILGAIGPKARPAILALLNATNAGGWLAQSTAFAVWDIDRQTNVVVEVLARTLHGKSRYRWSALKGLQQRGTDLKAASPIVQQALYDSNGGVRDEAERTLQQLDPERLQTTIDQLNRNAPLILQQSVVALQSKPNRIPLRAFTVIEFYGPKADSAVPALIEMLNQTPPTRRSYLMNSVSGQNNVSLAPQALAAIAAIGPAARDAVPALTNLLGGKHYNTADLCEALGGIGPNASEAVPVLEALLTRTNERVRLRGMGGFVTLPGNETVRFAAARALVEIAPGQASNAVSFLKKGNFKSVGYPLPELSAQVALWKAGMEKNPPVTNLMATLPKWPDFYLAPAAIQLLAEIGPEARPALPLLETFLKPGDNFRWDAAIAIQRIDPQEAARLGLPGLLLAY
jgi:HEAT repeat protein